VTAETTTVQPAEGRCEHCKQTRPLFRYEPDHNAHLDPYGLTCRWCTREQQPLLCARCWSAERELEDNDPRLNEEGETWAQILTGNARAHARSEADKAAVAGIAAVSGMGGGPA
jgi:hypothetical protein